MFYRVRVVNKCPNSFHIIVIDCFINIIWLGVVSAEIEFVFWHENTQCSISSGAHVIVGMILSQPRNVNQLIFLEPRESD
jgi:hypothetical protein